jgi:DnaD/phage-associated family protein
MAVYRQIQISFWTDDFVLDLTPEEKYFYMYLMTCSKSSQCGIYKLPMKVIEFETGYNVDSVDKLLKRFITYGKILYNYDTKEIMILNWIRYNFINSRNTITCINKELLKIKSGEFIKKFYEICSINDYPIKVIFAGIEIEGQVSAYTETSFQHIERGLEAASNMPWEEKEEIKEKAAAEEEIDKEREAALEIEEKLEDRKFKKVIDAFSQNIHPVTPLEFERLKDWCKEMEPEAVILAINEAVDSSARSMRYINGVLNSWLQLGLDTADKVVCYSRDWKDKRKGQNKKEKEKVANAAAYRYIEVQNE